MSDPVAPLRRGPWRYLRDVDVLHSLAITLLAALLSGGLVWLWYLLRVWRTAARGPLHAQSARVLLVFGRKLVGDRPEPDYAQRLRRCRQLACEGDVERVLLLGGCSGSRVSEAQAGADWLRASGFPQNVPLVLEQASIDSLENLRHARELLKTDSTLPPVALVTSRYHLARCLLLARRLGFDAHPVAAETELPRHARYRMRIALESAYLMWIDIGLRWALLIGDERMAARIR